MLMLSAFSTKSAEEREMGSRYCPYLKRVQWSMFMLTMLLRVSINLRSDVTMMNGMMLLFLDLTIADPAPRAVEDEDGYEPSIYDGDYVETYYGLANLLVL